MAQQPVSADITSDDKLWALLCYILTPIVPIIVLLMEDKKNRPFIKAHAMQALVFGIVYEVIGGVTSAIFIGLCILPLGFIACVYWGIKAYQGNYVNIPVITNFVKNQGWA